MQPEVVLGHVCARGVSLLLADGSRLGLVLSLAKWINMSVRFRHFQQRPDFPLIQTEWPLVFNVLFPDGTVLVAETQEDGHDQPKAEAGGEKDAIGGKRNQDDEHEAGSDHEAGRAFHPNGETLEHQSKF